MSDVMKIGTVVPVSTEALEDNSVAAVFATAIQRDFANMFAAINGQPLPYPPTPPRTEQQICADEGHALWDSDDTPNIDYSDSRNDENTMHLACDCGERTETWTRTA